jgi:glycine C-acetyltransferase
VDNAFFQRFDSQLDELRQQGLFKSERVIASPQAGQIRANDADVINLCANNYLGLASHPAIREAAHRAIDRYGYGMASVRFICGTQTVHKQLEAALSKFLGTEDTILYSSCWDANGGLFETVLGEQDAIISDALNHASIIDGIRLCKARRLRYGNRNLAELEQHLKDTQDCRTRLIATDGVFSMDGSIAPLREICDLADQYGALVMVDDSHATGFMGAGGRGTPEHCGVAGRIDFLTGTFGQGAGRWQRRLHQRQGERDLLAAPAFAALSLLEQHPAGGCSRHAARAGPGREHARVARDPVRAREEVPRGHWTRRGSNYCPASTLHPGDDRRCRARGRFADKLLGEGVYVIGFSFPVVPRGEARIRTQMSAGLSDAQLERALAAFIKVGKELELVK